MTTTSSASLSARIVNIKQAAGLVYVLFANEADAEWFLDNGEIAVTLVQPERSKTLSPYRQARVRLCGIMAGPGRLQIFELNELGAQGTKRISLRVADEIHQVEIH